MSENINKNEVDLAISEFTSSLSNATITEIVANFMRIIKTALMSLHKNTKLNVNTDRKYNEQLKEKII